MKLIDANRLSKRQYKDLINSLGGKFSFLERIKMGGTGVGGLYMIAREHPHIELRYTKATESVRVSIELLKNGLLIGLNNTKEIKLIPFHKPNVDWELIEKIHTSGSRREKARMHLSIDGNDLFLYTSGWNNRQVFRYFEKIEKTFA